MPSVWSTALGAGNRRERKGDLDTPLVHKLIKLGFFQKKILLLIIITSNNSVIYLILQLFIYMKSSDNSVGKVFSIGFPHNPEKRPV